jgi:hypothetical protein
MNNDMWNEYELKTDPFENEEGWYQRQLELSKDVRGDAAPRIQRGGDARPPRARTGHQQCWRALLLSNRR